MKPLSSIVDSQGIQWPDNAIEVGQIVGAWGIKGWLKVKSYSDDPQALFHSKKWYIKKNFDDKLSEFFCFNVIKAKKQNTDIVAFLAGITDRTLAENFKKACIFIPRSSFPSTELNEYYWVDLIGLNVINNDGSVLGKVTGLLDNGMQSILQIAKENRNNNDLTSKYLIPFVDKYIKEVKIATKEILVDWPFDF